MDISVKLILSLTVLTLPVSSNSDPSHFIGLARTTSVYEKAESAVTSSAAHVVESFHVTSDIRFRFATTTMVSVVRNTAAEAQEVTFDVTLPKEAFIMHFAMTIDNKTYDGEVKEKKEAKEQYQEAVVRGQSAGHVRQAARHANVFEVSVNVASVKTVTFTLSYQELLRRRRGVYEYELHVQPGQPVDDFMVEVNIQENQPLKYVRTPSLRTDELMTNEVEAENDFTLIDQPTLKTAKVIYKPSLKEQGEAGVKGRFVVQYDVDHAPTGDLLVVDGYFVHFFSPKLPPMPKDIIFVLDLSGSMTGTKISQLKEAMEVILGDLQKHDRFNIITFSSGVAKWRPGLVSASDHDNLLEASKFVKAMAADGMTNINLALLTAVKDFYEIEEKNRASIVFFLTDGQPTDGVRDAKTIAINVQQANEKNVAILSLAFGNGADFEALKTISAQNTGFARKIYEASDAALQVSSLYNEVSSVVMKNLSVSYLPSKVDEFSLTENNFPVVYNGTEVVICGFMPRAEGKFTAEITGLKDSGEVDLIFDTNDVTKFVIREEEIMIDITDIEEGGTKIETETESNSRDFAGLLERMWGFVTIKQLIRDRERKANNEEESNELKKRIIDMSLKYNLVTPLTSMVVTKPDTKEKSQVSLEDVDTLVEDQPRTLSSQHFMSRNHPPFSSIGRSRPIGNHGPLLSSIGLRTKAKKGRRLYSRKQHFDFGPRLPSRTTMDWNFMTHTQVLLTSTTTRPPYPTTTRTPMTLQSTKPCKTPLVNCFVNPCMSAMCPTFPFAQCRSNYCGGCNHEFWMGKKEVTSKCHKTKQIKSKDSILTALIVQSKSKSGCAVMKKIQAGRYTLHDKNNGIEVIMETYCPDSKCRKVGLVSLLSSANNGVQTVYFNASNPHWDLDYQGAPRSVKVFEKKKKLTLKYSHMSIILKRVQAKRFDKYVITFQVKDSTSYFGLLDAVLDTKPGNKKRTRRNKQRKRKVPGICKKVKSDVSKLLKAKDVKMYKLSQV